MHRVIVALVNGLVKLLFPASVCPCFSALHRYLISCSHLRPFRQLFLNQDGNSVTSTRCSSPVMASAAATVVGKATKQTKNSSGYHLQRQTTQECFQVSCWIIFIEFSCTLKVLYVLTANVLNLKLALQCSHNGVLFQHINESGKKRLGLNGGNATKGASKKFKLEESVSNNV